jgi:cytochrome c oxidase assembly factor CtaG
MRHLMKPVAIGAAMLVVGCVLLPPLSSMAGHLFAAHMAQHLLLIALAAPLLVLGGLEMRLRPVYAWISFVSVFLFWHWPAAFQWAATHTVTQLLELASILATAILFWSVALGSNSLNDGARALYVMTAAIVTDLPGVVMLFAPRAICTMPGEDAAAFGLTPLADQQLAGLLMWVPANLAFFGIATFLFARWIAEPKLPSQPLVTS